MPESNTGFSTTDAVWLRLAEKRGPSVATCLLSTRGTIDPDCFRRRVEDRILPHRRFRRVVELPRVPLTAIRWRDPNDFALSDHVSQHRIDSPSQVHDALARIIARPLPLERPLWRIDAIEVGHRATLLLARACPCIADDATLGRLLQEVLDEPAPGEPDRLFGLDKLFQSSRITALCRKSGSSARQLCNLLASRSDHDTPLKTPVEERSVILWSRAVRLQELQSAATALDASIEDLVLTAIAGGLRDELHKRDFPVERRQLSAALVVHPRASSDHSFGTKIGLAKFPLPIGIGSWKERLQAVQHELEVLTLSPERLALLSSERPPGLKMPEIEERILRTLARKTTVQVRLHDGPRRRPTLCGRPLDNLLCWPPLPSPSGIAITAAVCADALRFGLMTDCIPLPEAERAVSSVLNRLAQML